MGMAIKTVEQLFWTMLWILIILIIFVFIAQWATNNNIPVLSSVLGWAREHAGLEQ